MGVEGVGSSGCGRCGDCGEPGHVLVTRIAVVAAFAAVVGATLAVIDGGGGGSTSVGRDVEEGREGGRRGRAHLWVEVNGGTQPRLLPSGSPSAAAGATLLEHTGNDPLVLQQ